MTQQVTLATFDRPEPTGTSRLTQDQARQTAITFLEDHNISFSGLADHRDTSLGVGGADPKFDFMWQAHDPSGAWLPTWVYVTVAADGPVAAFGRESDPLKISTTPTVTSTSATAKALASGGATASDPELTVETRADGTQLLVWVISVRSNGAAPSLRIVWVDAQTGEVTSP